jgi:hypothetical protein
MSAYDERPYGGRYGFGSVIEDCPRFRYLFPECTFHLEPVTGQLAIEAVRPEPKHAAIEAVIEGAVVPDEAGLAAVQEHATDTLARWAPKEKLPSSVPPLHAVAEVMAVPDEPTGVIPAVES